MALTKADLAAIAAMIAEATKAPARSSTKATKAKAKPIPMADRRSAALGGVCEEHDLRFATASGRAWHFANRKHAK